MNPDDRLTRLASGREESPPPLDDAGAEREGGGLETRILIIEDEMMIAWMLESLLTEAGFDNVVIAADYDHACRSAAEAAPGLVVSDINLGEGKDGVEACVAICHAAAIPVIFVTAYAEDTNRDRIAGHFPAAEMLRKPVDRQTLIAAVQRALDRRRSN